MIKHAQGENINLHCETGILNKELQGITSKGAAGNREVLKGDEEALNGNVRALKDNNEALRWDWVW